MTPALSIIVASHNDADQTVLTIKSIRATSPPEVEIVVVDDCSATPLIYYVKEDEHTKLVTNRFRCGCGPSRHIGAMHARGDWLLICDSHMRFCKGWYEEWHKYGMKYSSVTTDGVITTVYCATCLGISSKQMDPEKSTIVYHGATMNMHGPDRQKASAPWQVFEAVWMPKEPEPEDGQELAACMGACYFVSRDWFLTLSPTRFLCPWGCDEQALSIASWLAGGSVRLAKEVKIGHKFSEDNEPKSFGIAPGRILFNKLLVMNAMFPGPLAQRLSQLLLDSSDQREAEVARRMYHDNFFLVGLEQAKYESLFTKSIEWYCEKFGIPLP